MKKIMTFAFALACAVGAYAQNELQVVPVAAEKGAETYVLVNLNNAETAGQVQNMELFIQWPEGWTVGAPGLTHKDVRNRTAEYDEDDEAYVSILAGGANDQGNNLIKYVYYAKNSDCPLKGGAGAIFRIKVTIPAGIPDGYYPITLVGGGDKSFIACSGNAGSEIWLDTQTSYIKVGNPSNAALALEGTVPSFVNEALAKETAITTLNLSGVTASNGTFTYVDGREVVAPTATVEADLQYVGDKEGYYSVNVPFAAEKSGNLYELSDYAIYYWIFDDASSVEAGETYLASGKVTLTGHGEIAGVETKTGQSGAYILDNQVWYGDNLTVKPTRGLFIDETEGGESGRRILINGNELTGITAAQIDAQSDNTYDIQGRQVQNAKNGVFVVNGKKQFVK